MATDQIESAGLPDLSGIVRRRRMLMTAVGAPLALATLLLAVFSPLLYRSEATLAIEEARLPGIGQTSTTQNQNYADQYIKDLTDQVLGAGNLINRLRAQGKLPANTDADKRKELTKALGRRLAAKVVSDQVLDPQTGRERTIITALQVRYDDRTPEAARDGAQWLIDNFVAADRKLRQSRAESYDRFLVSEIERRKLQVNAADKLLADFKQHNIGRLPELNALNMDFKERAQRDLDENQAQLRTLVNQRAFVQQQLQQAAGQNAGTQRLQDLEDTYRQRLQTYDPSHPDMLAMQREIEQLRSGAGQAGGTLRQQLATQRDILAQARQRYNDDHPDIVRLRANIAALEQRIAAGESPDTRSTPISTTELQLQTQLNSLDTQISSLQGQMTDARTRISAVQTQLEATPQVEREYSTLNQQLTLARAGYQEIMQRKIDSDANQAAISSGSTDVFRVTAGPDLPDTIATARLLALLIVGLGGAVSLALGAAMIAELLDGTVRGVRDIRQVLGVVPLGSIPEMQDASSRKLLRRQWFKLGSSVLLASTVLFFIGQKLTN
jgi:succinoglycan biosynthesis transport protein ExoP